MITDEMNVLLTRTGPGTPMGDLFRRYWIPALLDWELPEPDCPPVRVKLLGERLIAFRDTGGAARPDRRVLRPPRRVPVVRAQRGVRAALPVPRLEVRRDRAMRGPALGAGGERNAQAHKLKSYPCVELGGVVWAYMGPPDGTAAVAELRMGGTAARAPRDHQALAGKQLPAGARGRHRFEPRLVPAPRRHELPTRSTATPAARGW